MSIDRVIAKCGYLDVFYSQVSYDDCSAHRNFICQSGTDELLGT